MELIWVAWAVFGLIMGMLISVLIEREHDKSDNPVPDPDDNGRKHNGMDRRIPTPEEITMILTYFKVGASCRETEVLDYLIDKEGGDF